MSFFNADTLISGTDGLILKDLQTDASNPSSGFATIYVNDGELYFRTHNQSGNSLSLSLSGNTTDSLIGLSGPNSLISQSNLLFSSTNSNLTVKSSSVGEPKLELQNLANSTRGGTLHFNLEKSTVDSTDIVGSIEFNSKSLVGGQVTTHTYSNIHATTGNLEIKVNNNTPLTIGNTYSIFGGMGFNTNSSYYTTETSLTSTTSSSPQSITYSPFIVIEPSSYPSGSPQTYYINVPTTSLQGTVNNPIILRILVKKNSSNNDYYLTVSWSGSFNNSSTTLASLNDFEIGEGKYAEFIYFPDSSKFYVNKASSF